MQGKCPKCEKLVSYVVFGAVDARFDRMGGSTFNALAYRCPHCQTILSVQIDPVALKTDTVNEILKALGQQRRR